MKRLRPPAGHVIVSTRSGTAVLRRSQCVEWSRAGNVRGLEHVVRRSVLLAPERTRDLYVQHLALRGMPFVPADAGAAAAQRLVAYAEEVREVMAAVLRHGLASEAARALGIPYARLTGRLLIHAREHFTRDGRRSSIDKSNVSVSYFEVKPGSTWAKPPATIRHDYDPGTHVSHPVWYRHCGQNALALDRCTLLSEAL
ncbi:MAG: hypothetical protein HYV63_16065 [Candidatus Schekmanbacteria bacterium]|nr:hypothetical protein [Candidatus Schekmanbacteria bacterium]